MMGKTRWSSAGRRLFVTGSNSVLGKGAPRAINILNGLTTTGPTDYVRGWAWQQVLLNRRLAARMKSLTVDDMDSILLFEHHPVYTLGRGSNEEHMTFLHKESERNSEMRRLLSRKSRGTNSARLSIADQASTLVGSPQSAVESVCRTLGSPVVTANGAVVYRVERGGEVTFHGPGQLVVYPNFDLQRHPFQKDLHWFLRNIEEVIIRVLKHYGIDNACRDEINTGVWVGQNKIAAVGLAASRWITTHGFALNVHPDLSFFDTSNILPCGVPDRGVICMLSLLRQSGKHMLSMDDVAATVVREMEDVFGIETAHTDSIH